MPIQPTVSARFMNHQYCRNGPIVAAPHAAPTPVVTRRLQRHETGFGHDYSRPAHGGPPDKPATPPNKVRDHELREIPNTARTRSGFEPHSEAACRVAQQRTQRVPKGWVGLLVNDPTPKATGAGEGIRTAQRSGLPRSATKDSEGSVRLGRTLRQRPNTEGNWSGRRDSNPRPQPWQGCALPLSYARSCVAPNRCFSLGNAPFGWGEAGQ